MQKTKHDMVIEYIESLPIGEKVSVRQLARHMNLSEGTVYRAIKDAENNGLVSSIPKVGTIRIEKKQKRSIDSLTYRELSVIVEGSLLSGEKYSDVAPKAFFVATSLAKLRKKKPHGATVIICEYDSEIVQYARTNNLPLLLTSGIELSKHEILTKMPEEQIVISTPYDIFDAISAINQTILERVQSRELITISDIMTTNPYVLHGYDMVKDWRELSYQTGHSRFPVVDNNGRLEGMVTAYDVAEASPQSYIDDVMTPNPVVVHGDALLSYLGRLLVLEQVDLVPVVDEDNHLVGIVSLQDVIEAQQTMQKQPHLGDTFDNLIMSGFSLVAREPDVILSGEVTPYFLDEYGKLSLGVCNVFSANAAVIALRMQNNLLGQTYQVYTRVFEEVSAGEEVYLLPALTQIRGQFHASVRIEDVDERLLAVSEVDLLVRDKQ